MYLFKRCQNCGSETYGTTTRVIGTFLSVSQHCSNCSFTFKWASQPVVKSIPAGNILLSAAILYSGTLPAKVLRMLKIYGCATITSRTVPSSVIKKVIFSHLFLLSGTSIKLNC